MLLFGTLLINEEEREQKKEDANILTFFHEVTVSSGRSQQTEGEILCRILRC